MKRAISLLALCLAASMVLASCGSASGSASNKYIEIKKYDGLEVDKVDQDEVSDSDVDDYIDMQLSTSSTPKTKVPNRAIKKGDTILLDCSAKDKDGKTLSGTVLTDYELEIGSGSFIPGWEDACIGKPYGEEFTFDLKFPEGYGSEEISGKMATWTVTAKGMVVGEEKAELDDETAVKLAKNDNLDVSNVKEYKKAVKDMLTEQSEKSVHDTLYSEVWEAVMDETEVKEYPDGAVDEKVDTYIKTYTDMAKNYGMTYEEFLEQNGMTDKEVKKEMKAAAEDTIKRQLITDLLIDKLKIKISDDDYQKKYEELATQYGFGDVDSFLKQAGEDAVKEQVRETYVGDWLIEHCKQVEPKEDAEEAEGSEPDADTAEPEETAEDVQEDAEEEEPEAEDAQEQEGEASDESEAEEAGGERVQEDKAAGDSMKD